MICCMFSLESPRWGDSNENTQHTFMFKKIKKISLLTFLTWRYNQPSLARTTPLSNKFSWSQRCSSHWSSTVYVSPCSSNSKNLLFIICTSWHRIICSCHQALLLLFQFSFRYIPNLNLKGKRFVLSFFRFFFFCQVFTTIRRDIDWNTVSKGCLTITNYPTIS